MVRNLVSNLENLKLYKLHHIEHGTEHTLYMVVMVMHIAFSVLLFTPLNQIVQISGGIQCYVTLHIFKGQDTVFYLNGDQHMSKVDLDLPGL